MHSGKPPPLAARLEKAVDSFQSRERKRKRADGDRVRSLTVAALTRDGQFGGIPDTTRAAGGVFIPPIFHRTALGFQKPVDNGVVSRDYFCIFEYSHFLKISIDIRQG